MVPKVRAALAVLARGWPEVVIADGSAKGVSDRALADADVGTRVVVGD